MLKRILRISLTLIVLLFVCATGVLASWEQRFPTVLSDTSGVARTYYPADLGFTGQTFIDAGYIDSDGLNTNMQSGTTSLNYMLSTTKAFAVLPSLPVGGHQTVDFYAGYSPDQTGFPVIVGDGGLYYTADAAALEAANNFEFDYSGYIDTTFAANKKLIYKQEAYIERVSSAGNITAGILSAESYELTVTTDGAWHTLDVSDYVGTDASGVVLELITDGNPYSCAFRKTGSTDDRYYDITHTWVMIGLDSSFQFDYKIENAALDVYIRGYTESGYWAYNTNGVDLTVDAFAAWTTEDLSAVVPAGTDGVIVEVYSASNQATGLRMFGSTDARTSSLAISNHYFAVIGVDSSRRLQYYAGNTDVEMFLIGWTIQGSTFAANATNVSAAGAGAYEDWVAPTDSRFVFIELIAAGTGQDVGLRKNGSSEDRYQELDTNHGWAVCEVDYTPDYEIKVSDVGFDAYRVGYATAGVVHADATTYTYSKSVTAAVASGEHRIQVTADTTDLKLYVDTVEEDSVALAGASVTNNVCAWEASMGNVSPYVDWDIRDVGGVEVIKYQPITMIIATALPDRTGAAQDSVFVWGENKNVSTTYSSMTSYESTTGSSTTTAGFEVTEVGLPSTWFASGSGATNLPMYDNFNEIAANLGMPVQSLYAWAIIGFAIGFFLLVAALTKSLLGAGVAFIIVLAFGASMTIIPMWIPFTMIVLFGGVLYLYTQMSY